MQKEGVMQIPPQGIVVTVKGKGQRFQMRFWRRAITAYLDAVWAENLGVVNTEITVRGITLQRSHDFYGFSARLNGPDLPVIPKEEILFVKAYPADVEIGLARFVRNKKLRMIVICFPTNHQICIWHNGRGSEPICATFAGSLL